MISLFKIFVFWQGGTASGFYRYFQGFLLAASTLLACIGLGILPIFPARRYFSVRQSGILEAVKFSGTNGLFERN